MENKYFESMYIKVKEYDDLLDTYRKVEVDISKQFGYDSDEMVSFLSIKHSRLKETNMSRGEMIAYLSWKNSTEAGYGEFVVDYIFSDDGTVIDLVDTLKDAGIKEFVLADDSTALMRTIHWLIDTCRCEFVGPCEIEYGERRDTLLGLKFRID